MEWSMNDRRENELIAKGRIARTYSHCRQNGHDKTDIPGGRERENTGQPVNKKKGASKKKKHTYLKALS